MYIYPHSEVSYLRNPLHTFPIRGLWILKEPPLPHPWEEDAGFSHTTPRSRGWYCKNYIPRLSAVRLWHLRPLIWPGSYFKTYRHISVTFIIGQIGNLGYEWPHVYIMFPLFSIKSEFISVLLHSDSFVNIHIFFGFLLFSYGCVNNELERVLTAIWKFSQ